MVEARRLTKTYATLPAVDDVSFIIRPGEVLGYLGPNGSGKSTTVKMLTGLLEPTRGEVLFNGRAIRDDLPAYRSRLGYVPEEQNLYPYLSGLEYLDLVGTLRGIEPQLLAAKSEGLLRLFSLNEHRHSPLASYSKGMRQRVLLSAALLHNPDVIVFDEPLSGLDVTSALIFKNLIKALAREGKCILYCSHVLEVVEKVCSHVLILYRGKLVAYDSIAAVRNLRALPSLEEVFSQLVQETDTEQVAWEIAATMKQV